jgi:hypothetical protein
MANLKLQVGQHVVDNFGDEGIVVKITPGSSREEHGTVYVWQLNRTEYGADNCEHYPEFEWWNVLKILEDGEV